ncbi:efflux RND transporter periplasmic adaptor subunit [Pedomonas mirosovicensis]|uniref:efflux RND transporter periplasmic adaptor subunit n=1 Tax=Pedomonas mirosovicensis TaxID=2908641 RepID=UPI002168E02E|nr:efflux RND transporter periplasmic adaptor subunit [Pedomonas mirosovicensis]MCH8685815.1 efflux RND transporter periplasmic adaptor subunit [Pedomonas mirosovicensis]
MLTIEKSKFSRKSIVIGLVGAGLLGGIVGFTALSGESDAQAADDGQTAEKAGAAPRVTVLVPGASQVTARIKVTGTISAQYDMPVSVEGDGGRVAAVLVEAGDWVKKGQVMARINTDVLRPQVAQLAAALDEAKADARLAVAEYERVKAVSGSGAISREDVERRAASAETAQARAKVAAAQLEEAKARLARAEIRAPADGRVLVRAVEVGQAASPGVILFRVAKDGLVELRGEVAEQDMPSLKVGQKATVRITGVDRDFAGKVWLLGPTIDPESRLGTVRVALTSNPLLRPGAFAHGFVLAGEAKKPVLPHSALQADSKGAFVYVVGGDNKIARRAVRLGTTTAKGVVIEEGLVGSERVVATAGAFLREGEAIAPVMQQQAS